ncbi:hypothetical protein [Amycolatopsis sp. CB00013]|uniref:hypothetical protein n=1 Tax=Amycolatopsis sp. CB00013 TaxID=1703945 RepID=UPI0011613024|nr:hypothetical protein [Amycolatopsis sp. CB00013]
MAYPDQDQIARCDPILDWIDEHYLRADPYAFSDSDFRPILRLLASRLEVDPNGIFCIGSGAVGLSLDPGKIADGKLKRFDHESDIDLAIVSEVHFETAWRDLRRAAQPTFQPLDREFADNLKWQKKRFFDGAILANVLLPFLSFGPHWISVSTELSEKVAIALDREVAVNFWIYRDYWSVRNYVSSGLMKCKEKLL